MSDDITETLEEWPFEPGAITVRKIIGEDGQPKVQMRLELGLIQMDVQGRPDGLRPHGRESYLHFYKEKLKKHIARHDSAENFRLSPQVCADLRTESLYFYYRYLSLFHLGEFEQVAADTARNLEVAEFLKKYAETEDDRLSIEQYRPYILMMNTQARARIARKKDSYDALGIIRGGIRKIRRFMEENVLDWQDKAEESHEIRLLQDLEKEILTGLPEDSLEKLREELKVAVASEDFEKAASLRDRIRVLHDGPRKA